MKKLFVVLLIIVVGIQFIRPKKNVSEIPSSNDIRVHYPLPGNAETILKRACYDCHSNNTYYPWYTNIQPIGWWMQHHVDEGVAELNFSDFAAYPLKKADHKLEETIEMIEEQKMPLKSYTWMHKDAVLSQEEIQIVKDWANELRTTIQAKM